MSNPDEVEEIEGSREDVTASFQGVHSERSGAFGGSAAPPEPHALRSESPGESHGNARESATTRQSAVPEAQGTSHLEEDLHVEAVVDRVDSGADHRNPEEIIDLEEQEDSLNNVAPAFSQARKRPRDDENRQPSSKLQEGANSECPICFEEWTSSGEHQITSLACGHLFGRSCIHQWISRSKRCCPTCKRPARIAQIRPIFMGSSTNQLATEVEAVKLKNEMEMAHSIIGRQTGMINQLQGEVVKKDLLIRSMQWQMDKLQSRLAAQASRVNQFRARAGARRVVSRLLSQSRVAAIHPFGVALVSEQYQPHRFGVSRACLLDPTTHFQSNASDLTCLHTAPIRDISCAPSSGAYGGQFLTASMDRTCKVVDVRDMRSTSVVDLVTSAYSCCWSQKQDNIIFCGVERGQFFAFDLRNLSNHLSYFSHESLQGPVHSIVWCSANGGQLVAATHNGLAWLDDPVSGDPDGKTVQFNPFTHMCHSMSTLQGDTGNLLCSFRGDNPYHSVMYNGVLGEDRNPPKLLDGHQSTAVMSKTAGMRIQDTIFIASGDEHTKQGVLWHFQVHNSRITNRDYIGDAHPSYILCASLGTFNEQPIAITTSAQSLSLTYL